MEFGPIKNINERYGLSTWRDENSKLHREDGPAVEWHSGKKEWWLNGKEYTEEEFNKEILKRKLKLI